MNRPRHLIDLSFPSLHRLGFALFAGICVLLVAGCNDTGPIFPTAARLDPWVKSSDAVDPQSDVQPVVVDPVVRFSLHRGSRNSRLRTSKDFGLNQTHLIGFDLRVSPDQLPRHPITLSRFLRLAGPGGRDVARIISVELDARRGATVLGRSCVPVAALDQWHTIEMRIAMADDDSGFIEVFCDRKPIWARNGLRTTMPPVCRKHEGCTQPVPAPVRFEWQIGLMAPGRTTRAITVDMQRIFYHRLFVIPNRVGPI